MCLTKASIEAAVQIHVFLSVTCQQDDFGFQHTARWKQMFLQVTTTLVTPLPSGFIRSHIHHTGFCTDVK